MRKSADSNSHRGPARPATLTVDFYQDADGLVVHKKRGGGPGLFLLLWLTAWTVGCVALAVQVVGDPQIGTIAFAVPFWAAWLFVAAYLVWIMFGQETLLLRPDAALFRRTALVRLTSRVVPRSEIQSFRECRSKHTENDHHVWGIEMATLGKPVRFAFRLPDAERAWLVHQLNRYHSATADDPSAVAAPSQPNDAPSSPSDSLSTPAAAHEALRLETTAPKPPSDCRWTFEDRIGAIEFRQRGRLSLTALVVLLFINAFWNGIVSVFVLLLFDQLPANNNPPQGWEWWGMFVFLIPFEAIGLLLFAGLVFTALEPFRRTIWRFEADRIVAQTRLCGLRRTRRWNVARLDRLELRRGREEDEGSQQVRLSSGARAAAGQFPFTLAFVSADNVDLCCLEDLTEGEARWIAHAVFDRRAHWFDG